jgi:hypothetical protein
VGVTLALSDQPDELEQFFDSPALALGARQPEADVACRVQMREKGTVLGDIAHTAGLGREVCMPVFDHRPPDRDEAFVRALEARQQPQQGGLAATRGPEDSRERTFRHFQVEIVQHDVLTEGLLQARDDDPGHMNLMYPI